MATMQNLPSELLLDIFSYYIRSEGHEAFSRNIPLVCKYWNDVSSKASLWRNVKIHESNYLLNISQRGLLCDTQSLEFHYHVKRFPQINLSAVFKNIRDLKALDLASNTVRRAGIMAITENCPHLERLCLRVMECRDMRPHDLDQFLTVCGRTLKHLDMTTLFSPETGQHLVSGIAANCPLLEILVFKPKDEVMPFPIHKLRSGCPRLRELEFRNCQLIASEKNDSLGCGFKDLKKFRARSSNFSGLDIHSLLKDSMDLEHLKLCCNDDLVFSNISNIPSDKLRFLIIGLNNADEHLEAIEDATFKWRRTLSALYLDGWRCDVTPVLKLILQDNPNPQLKSLTISGKIDPHFFEKFIQQCQNLISVQINWNRYYGREKMKEALEFLKKSG